jgi:hypothetical protein
VTRRYTLKQINEAYDALAHGEVEFDLWRTLAEYPDAQLAAGPLPGGRACCLCQAPSPSLPSQPDILEAAIHPVAVQWFIVLYAR